MPFDTAHLSSLAALALALVVGGLATGLLAGLFGVGGGAVLVPVLYETLGALHVPEAVRMPMCVGTSLAVILPTSWRSFRAHRALGAADLGLLRLWALPVVLGVLGGSAVARFAPPGLFKGVFVGVAGVSALRLLAGRDSWRLGSQFPGRWATRAWGAVIGVLAALMGVGGGQLASMFMSLYGRPIHQAVATGAGMGILIAAPGTLGYIVAGWPQAAAWPGVTVLQFPAALGYVSLLGFVLLTPTSAWAAPWGARLAHRLSRRQLELAFGSFLLLVCLRFLWSLAS